MKRTLAKGLVLLIEAGLDLVAQRMKKRSERNAQSGGQRARRRPRRRSIFQE